MAFDPNSPFAYVETAGGVQGVLQGGVLYNRYPPYAALSLPVFSSPSPVILIDSTTGLPYTAGGGGGGGASTIADGADVTQGAIADAASTVGGTGTVEAKLRLMTTQLDTVHNDLIAANTQLPTVLGNQAAAASLGTALSTEDIARLGIITETAPASDTASSGLNGRLQRIAQNITTWIGKLTTTASMDANRLPVSDPDSLALTVTSNSAAATTATVTTPIASPGVVNWTTHGFSANQAVTITGGTLPGELTTPASGATFYVSATGLGASSFQVSRTPGGASINFTGSSSGTQTGTQLLVIALQDLTGYQSVGVQVTSVGGGATIAWEQSEDQQTWVAVPGGQTTQTSGGAIALATIAASASAYQIPRRHRHFRLRVTAYTSGTQTVVANANKATMSTILTYAGANVAGSAANSAARSGNPVPVASRVRTANDATLVADDTADLISDFHGHLKVSSEYQFLNLAATNGAGAAVKASAGILHAINVNTAVATATLSLYDAASATNPIAVIDCGTVVGTKTFNTTFATGLFWVLAGANANVTVSYR